MQSNGFARITAEGEGLTGEHHQGERERLRRVYSHREGVRGPCHTLYRPH